jgi:hypothetical protein
MCTSAQNQAPELHFPFRNNLFFQIIINFFAREFTTRIASHIPCMLVANRIVIVADPLAPKDMN